MAMKKNSSHICWEKNPQTNNNKQRNHKIQFKVVTFLQLLRHFFQIQNAL